MTYMKPIYSLASGLMTMFGAVFAVTESWPRAIALLLMAIVFQMYANE